MATPANRVPVRIARGTKANLDTAIAAGDLKEGEVCYATDENGLYVVEGGVLTQAGTDLSAASIDALSDVDTSTVAPTDGQVLAWNNTDSEWQPVDAASSGATVINDLTDVTTVGPGDPSFASVSLLARGAAYQDDSSNSNTLTNAGATLETGTTKFGGGSYGFLTNSTCIDIASSTSLDISSGDWTVEMWAYHSAADTGTHHIMAFGDTGSALAGYGWGFRIQSGRFYVQYQQPNSSTTTKQSASIGWTNNTWHHIAFTRSGDTLRYYIDGNEIGPNGGNPTNSDVSGGDPGQDNEEITIGSRRQSGSIAADSWGGYLEEVRVTKGVARYTASTYTVPTTAFLGDSTGPSDGQVLTWVNANSRWEPASLQGASVRSALGIGEYADDAAAGTGGVASGALYYNTTSSDYRLKT